MNKLYKKSEIWFAIVWIIIYVAGSSVAEGISETIGIQKSVTLFAHAFMCMIALIWLKKNDLYEKYGLCRTSIKASKFLYYIPLIFLVSCNLWFGVTLNLSVVETLLYMGSMICVGFLEELIFRGFLFKAMCKDDINSAIIVSSVTFGIGHIINLFNGSGADIVSNLCQIVSAIAFGFLFVIIFYRGRSLLPCIAAHSAINVLSAVADETNNSVGREIGVAAILSAVAILYTYVLLKTLPQTENNEK